MFQKIDGRASAPVSSRMRAAPLARRAMRDASGAVALYFAVGLIPVLGMIGAAIDYSRASAARGLIQTAVDAAVLAGAQESDPNNRQKVAGDMLNANLADASFDGAGQAVWAVDAGGAFTGRVDVSVRNVFMAMFGRPDTLVSATSAAMLSNALVPSNVTLSLQRATGASWKDVSLYVHEAGAATDARVQSFVYQPGWNKGGITQPTGTMTVTKYNLDGTLAGQTVYNQNSDFTWPAAVSSGVALGNTYDKVYLVMTVQGDGCADGLANTSRTSESSSGYTYNKDSATNDCVPSGTVHAYGFSQSTTISKNLAANPVVAYSTDSAVGAGNLFVGLRPGTTDQGAKQMPNGVKPTVYQVFPCGSASSAATYYAWEDTPQTAADYPWQGSWANQDIIFKVEMTCAGANANFRTGGPRLLR